MYRMWMGMGLVAVLAVTVGICLGSAFGHQNQAPGFESQTLVTV